MEIVVFLCFILGAAAIGGVFFIGIFVAIIAAVRGQPKGSSLFGGKGLRAWLASGDLLSGGTPARGIFLYVASTGRRTTYYGRRCEIRLAKVDIELPGTRAYEVQTNVYIPLNLVRDVLPGSTMELRIDPAKPNLVLVVGPDVGYAQGMVRTA